MKDIKEIEKLATEFREAIILAIEKKSPNMLMLETFPRGCCGNASDLLLYYLALKGFKTKYINGHKDGAYHGWLYYENKGVPYYIDITADQFGEEGVTDKVIVKPMSECIWHQNKYKDIKIQDVLPINKRPVIANFMPTYDVIIENLNEIK